MKFKVATLSEMSKIQIGEWKAALITYSFSVSIPFVKRVRPQVNSSSIFINT